MKKDLFYYVDKLSNDERAGVFVIGLMMVLGIAQFRIHYPSSLIFSLFEPIPICFVAFFSGRFFGFSISLFAPFIYLAAENSIPDIDQSSEPILNLSIRFFYFIVLTLLTSKLAAYVRTQNQIVMQDPLTGAVTRKYFEFSMTREVIKRKSSGAPMTLAYIDIDNFTEINDSFGHSAGDEILKIISRTIQNQTRKSDVLCRLNGDEFALALISIPDFHAGSKALKRVFVAIKEEMLKHKISATVSLGAVTFYKFDLSFASMLRQADEIMYEVKERGKNNMKHISYPHNK